MGEMSFAELIDNWDLFSDAIYSAAVAGAVLGFLSVYVVLRRMVFVSAAVTQAAGFGVALMFWLAAVLIAPDPDPLHATHAGEGPFGVDPVWGAVAMSLVVAAILIPDPERLGLSREAMLGTMFVFCSAAAVYLQAKIPQGAHDIRAIIFGTSVLVLPEDFSRLARVGAVVMIVQLWWFRGLSFASFDRVSARVQGLPVLVLDGALFLSIGIMIGVSARALGALPVFALSTLPGAAAIILGRGYLSVTFALAVAFGVTAGVGGYIIAFMRGLEGMGSVQTLVAVIILVIALAIRGTARVVRSLLQGSDH